MNAAETYAQAATAVRRREVVVNGRRVKTVDVHAHCAVPEAMALMGRKVDPQALTWGRIESARWTNKASTLRR